MAIQSDNDFKAALSAGQKLKPDFNKITGAVAYTAGRAYDMSMLNGSPVANAWAGTALAWRSCDETTGNGTQIFGIPHGGNVAAMVKQMISMSMITTSATGFPATFQLVDLQGYWPGISNNTTAAQTLTGTPTLRYANGAGLQMYQVQTAVGGATAQNIAVSYTNQAGTAGRALPVTVAMTLSPIVGHISHSGVAANNYTPFLPRANGDTGIQNAASVTFSQANTGTSALCLARPLEKITIGAAGILHEKDLVNQIPSMPIVKDGACLVWLMVPFAAVAASSTFAGDIGVIWG
jgi:hypothetical protein